MSKTKSFKGGRVIPGFGLSFGITIAMLSILILIPLASVLFQSFRLSPKEFFEIVTMPNVLYAFATSIGCALIAALINCFFGVILAWVLVRYEFPGKRIMDGMIELPFCLPTAVAGITLSKMYSTKGEIYGEPSEAWSSKNDNIFEIHIKDSDGLIKKSASSYSSEDIFMTVTARLDESWETDTISDSASGHKLDYNVIRFTLDNKGSLETCSEYDYLGYEEIQDVKEFRNFIRDTNNIGKTIKFWGPVLGTFGNDGYTVEAFDDDNTRVCIYGANQTLIRGDYIDITATYTAADPTFEFTVEEDGITIR